MNYETYENLIRSIDRRIARARVTGDWKEVSESITERDQLINEWRLEYPQPPLKIDSTPGTFSP